MDIENLMTEKGMRTWTDDQRETFVNDAAEMRQLTQIVHARLGNTAVDGDRAGAAGRRARKVARKMNRVARLLEKAAAETEGLNALYRREVLDLPERRARELQQKESRRQRLGIAASTAEAAIAESLTNSVNALHGVNQPGNPQVNTVQPAPVYTPPMPHHFPGAGQTAQPVGNIGDLFPEAL